LPYELQFRAEPDQIRQVDIAIEIIRTKRKVCPDEGMTWPADLGALCVDLVATPKMITMSVTRAAR
jgi:hypothetical protein